ncbi:TraB/GumN family protein [Altererythrobacter aestiaquae]|uniref:TraB/GumN family protein n=2 Tax=Pontixanthobacter aestiaquae TaxID=1509367 RepID=A0A844Z538_9SPHN|nr:TraB/GumN family protein [Pontixanthobacter aestiaquae]
MWTITTARGAVILVGEIREVPKSTPWFPGRLERATQNADRVILGIKPKISPGDMLRLIFAGGKITKLPKGTAANDYLDADRRARLAALETRYNKDYSRRSFLMTSFDLLSRQLGLTKNTGKDATEVVKKAARKADVPSEPVGTVRGEDLLDSLADAPPESHLPCLDAAMTATEIGPELIEQRGQDWSAFDIPAVMNNPLEVALSRCWPWTDADVASELRGQWVDAISGAAAGEGTTLAVVPLRTLAENGGVLDVLQMSGFEVKGPEWRKEGDAAQVFRKATQSP